MSDKYSNDSEFVIDLRKGIWDFIEGGAVQPGTDDKFNDLALRLFEYQFSKNIPYQKFCVKRGVTPDKIDSWERIPAVPVNAFKEVALCTFAPEDADKVFLSSGTTDPAKRSKVYVDKEGLRFLDLSYIRSVEAYVFPRSEKLRSLLMFPGPDVFPPDSVFVYGPMKTIAGHYLEPLEFFVTKEGFNLPGLIERMKRAEAEQEPVLVMGATFGWVHVFDFCKAQGIKFKLAEGSRFLDGGGYKGKSREMTKEEYFKLAGEISGIHPAYLLNSYGMSESQSIFPDNALYNYLNGNESEPRYKMTPAWARVVMVDPETLDPLPKGEKGLVKIYSLSNIHTVMALQTDDIGHEIGSGFEVVGRAMGAESRGCSIAMDEIVNAQK